MYSIANHSKHVKPQGVTKKTLDVQHNQKMQLFVDSESKINSLHDEINKMRSCYDELNVRRSGGDVSCVDEMIMIYDKILLLESELKELESSMNEVDYFTNTSDILFKYYDIVEKGDQKDEIFDKKMVVGNTILKYLINPERHDDDLKSLNDDKATLLEKYMNYTEYNYIKNIETDQKDKCNCCESSNRNILINDGLIYCNECHNVEYIIIDHDRPSYKDPPKEISYFAYKRINHFNESSIIGKILRKLKNILIAYKIFLASKKI